MELGVREQHAQGPHVRALGPVPVVARRRAPRPLASDGLGQRLDGVRAVIAVPTLYRMMSAQETLTVLGPGAEAECLVDGRADGVAVAGRARGARDDVADGLLTSARVSGEVRPQVTE